jgi:hypothetical protein
MTHTLSLSPRSMSFLMGISRTHTVRWKWTTFLRLDGCGSCSDGEDDTDDDEWKAIVMLELEDVGAAMVMMLLPTDDIGEGITIRSSPHSSRFVGMTMAMNRRL